MTSAADTDWWTHAACAGDNTRLWFSSNPQPGKEICTRCPVRPECLYDALQSEAPNGIWGGLTAKERGALPELTGTKADALTTLRELLAATADNDQTPAERTNQPMTTAPANPEPPAVEVRLKAIAGPSPEQATVGALLAWGDQHVDRAIRDQAAQARAAVTGLRTRYTADRELEQITSEAAQLEERLAELHARQEQLAPAKPKKRKSPLDYDAAVVRAWARDHNIPCPDRGRVPKNVLDAWRGDTGDTAAAS